MMLGRGVCPSPLDSGEGPIQHNYTVVEKLRKVESFCDQFAMQHVTKK